VRIVRHASEELGSWEQATVVPARLEGLVHRITGYTETTPGPTRRIELPANQVTLIVALGPPIDVAYPGLSRGPVAVRSFVSGLHATHAVVGSGGHQAGVQVSLTPFGARALLGGMPLGELAHREVDLENLLGPEAPLLAERLAEAATWERRLGLVEGFVARRVAAGPPATPSVEHAFRRMRATRGAVTVEELARELGCSRRHLAKAFASEVGLSPKAVARVERFRHAVSLIDRGTELAEAAQRAGFYDQAHFNRDVRAFAGRSPTELLAARLPDDGGFDAGGSQTSKSFAAGGRTVPAWPRRSSPPSRTRMPRPRSGGSARRSGSSPKPSTATTREPSLTPS
jgi:AraC-like DNA-binding protein